MTYDLRSTSICVSGYPAIAATAVYLAAQQVAVLPGNPAAVTLPFWMRATLDNGRHRCNACNRFVLELDDGARLRFRGYCVSCVDALVRTCVASYARLPTASEFYCPGCHRILALTEKSGETGLSRNRCKPCLALRWRRSREKARAAEQVRAHG